MLVVVGVVDVCSRSGAGASWCVLVVVGVVEVVVQ